MKTSFTRYSVVLVLVLQWLSVAFLIHISNGYTKIFYEFSAELPLSTVVALQATRPALLLPIAAAITMFVIAAESLIKSEATRYVVQALNLCFWMIFFCYCLGIIAFSLVRLIEKLS